MASQPAAVERSSPSGAAHEIDWEALFEQSQLGLIPLVGEARSPDALKKIVAVIAESLLVRRDDSPEQEALKAELAGLVPADATADDLPRLIEDVTATLRRIKEERVARAAEHAANPPPSRRHRRRHDRPKPAKKPAKKAAAKKKKRKRKADHGLGGHLLPGSSVGWFLALAALIVAGAGLALAVVNGGGGSPGVESQTLQFIDEMTRTAGGEKLAAHVFGGALRTGRSGGRFYVAALGVPPKACASAGWVFANKGTVVINRVLPPRISPQILKELCGRAPGGATFAWFPAEGK